MIIARIKYFLTRGAVRDNSLKTWSSRPRKNVSCRISLPSKNSNAWKKNLRMTFTSFLYFLLSSFIFFSFYYFHFSNLFKLFFSSYLYCLLSFLFIRFQLSLDFSKYQLKAIFYFWWKQKLTTTVSRKECNRTIKLR